MGLQVIAVPADAQSAIDGGVTLDPESNASQTISVTGTPTGGTFELTWPGHSSVTVPRNASSAALQALLDAAFGAGNTLVGGGPLPGTPLTVAFQGALAGETIALPTIDDTLLSGGSTPHAHVVVVEPGGGDVKLRDAYATRLGLIISANVADVWVSLGTDPAVVGEGIAVRAGGDPVHITGWAGEVHVISAGAAQVAYTELDAEAGEDGGEEPTGAAAFVPSGPSDDYFETAVATTPDVLASTPGAGGGWSPNVDESISPAIH